MRNHCKIRQTEIINSNFSSNILHMKECYLVRIKTILILIIIHLLSKRPILNKIVSIAIQISVYATILNLYNKDKVQRIDLYKLF